MRYRIRDNLTPGERWVLKDIVTNFPGYELRVRKEDKGLKFVVADEITDNQQVQLNLNNPVNYLKVANDPTWEFVARIEIWAKRNMDRRMDR